MEVDARMLVVAAAFWSTLPACEGCNRPASPAAATAGAADSLAGRRHRLCRHDGGR